MIQATAAQLVGQFAGNLRAQLAQSDGAASHNVSLAPSAAEPISGLMLLVRVIWSRLAGLFSGQRI